VGDDARIVTDPPKPVLLAYDGSEGSAAAIAVAGRLLGGRSAIVCHVWTGTSQAVFRTPPSGLPGVLKDAAEELDEFDRETAERVAAEGAELARSAGFDAEAVAERRETKTWRRLLDAAARHDAAVVVTGAHGVSGMGRALLGSVSTGVVHHSRLPVLVVPGTTGDEQTSGPVLLSYDGSEGARRAISAAGLLFADREVIVFHTWESWMAEAPALAGSSATVQGLAAELDQVADEQSSALAAEGVQVAESAGFVAEGLSERATGPAWKAVLDAADQRACAAIVVGSRGLTGISAALGSISNGVVHHSRRPVLVVPADDG
jgi:nucleotide-binding universal stress UspA family protein